MSDTNESKATGSGSGGLERGVAGAGGILAVLAAILMHGGSRVARVAEHALPLAERGEGKALSQLDRSWMEHSRANPDAFKIYADPNLIPHSKLPVLPDVSAVNAPRTLPQVQARPSPDAMKWKPFYDPSLLRMRAQSLLAHSQDLEHRLLALSLRMPLWRYQALRDRWKKNDDQIRAIKAPTVEGTNFDIIWKAEINNAEQEQREINQQIQEDEKIYG